MTKIPTKTLFATAFIFVSSALQAAPDLDRAMKNPNNWAHPRGQYNNQGYSALNQINTKNVKDLKLAWTFSTGVNRGHEAHRADSRSSPPNAASQHAAYRKWVHLT